MVLDSGRSSEREPTIQLRDLLPLTALNPLGSQRGCGGLIIEKVGESRLTQSPDIFGVPMEGFRPL